MRGGAYGWKKNESIGRRCPHVKDEIQIHIRSEMEEKMKKMKFHMLYTNSKTAPTEEEREAAKVEYLQMVGKCRTNTIVNL